MRLLQTRSAASFHAFVAATTIASIAASASASAPDVTLLSQRGGICSAVAPLGPGKVAGNFGPLFTTFDVTNPAAPTQLASLAVGDVIWDIDVVGSLAYVCASGAGVAVVNVADPAHPQLLTTIDTDGTAVSAAVNGSMLYVADGTSVKLFSLAIPTAPALVGTFADTGWNFDLAVSGTTLCVCHSDGASSGVRIVNVANPAAPVLQGTYLAIDPGSIAMSGNLLYVPNSIYGLQIVNVTNPAVPTLLSTCPCDGTDLWTVTVAGTKAYVGGWRKLYVVDVSNALAPVALGSATTNNLTPRRIAVSGTKAYVAEHGGLGIWNVATPAVPFLNSRVAGFGTISDVALQGTTAYVSSYYEGLWILNASDPHQPVTLSHTAIDGSIEELLVQGAYAYLSVYLNSGESRILIYNISVPSAPVLVANKAMPAGFDISYGISKWGNNLFVATFQGLRVLNVTNPASPTWTGFLSLPGNPMDVSVEGNLAAVVDDTYAMYLVNVSNPAAPTLSSTTVFNEYLNEVVVKNSIVYVGKSYGALARYSAANPVQPVALPLCQFGSWNSDLAVDGSTVWVAGYGQGLHELDFTSGNGVWVGNTETTGDATEVAVAGNLIAVGDGQGGLFLFGTCGGSADLNCDGFVNAADLALLLAAWGSTGSAADLDADGIVTAADLAILLSSWG